MLGEWTSFGLLGACSVHIVPTGSRDIWRRLEVTEKTAFGAVAKWLGIGLQNRHTWVQIPSAPLFKGHAGCLERGQVAQPRLAAGADRAGVDEARAVGSHPNIVRAQAPIGFAVLAVGVSVSCALMPNLDELSSARDAGAQPVDAADIEVLDGPDGACACVDAPPTGFRGPLAAWNATSVAPACGGAYGAQFLEGVSDVQGAAATCGCTCGAATGTSCPSSFSATVFANNACTGSKCDTVTLAVGQCTKVGANCNHVNGISATITPTGGSCAAQPTKSVPPRSNEKAVRLCERAELPAQGACKGSQVCVPLPPSPFEARPCIASPGDVACPAFYSYKRVVYSGMTDTRDCSACTCNGPAGTCTASIQVECGGSVKSLANACLALPDPVGVQLMAQPTFAGSCAPVGGQPIGALAGTGATTLCCVP